MSAAGARAAASVSDERACLGEMLVIRPHGPTQNPAEGRGGEDAADPSGMPKGEASAPRASPQGCWSSSSSSVCSSCGARCSNPSGSSQALSGGRALGRCTPGRRLRWTCSLFACRPSGSRLCCCQHCLVAFLETCVYRLLFLSRTTHLSGLLTHFPCPCNGWLRQEEGQELGEESDTFVSPQGPQDAVWRCPL